MRSIAIPAEIGGPPAAVAEILSPSRIRCFMDCPVRWWFKYVEKLPDPQTGNMALGKAIHSVLAQNFTQKTETQEDLPVAGALALFRQAWAQEREQTEFRDDEDPAELVALGLALASRYLTEVAPAIDPAAVEIRVEGEIEGVRVQGWIDLLDLDGRIIDIKTASRRPSAVDSDHRFQIATYVALTPGASGQARLDTLIKTRQPSLLTQTFAIDEQDLLSTRRLYPLAQQAMQSRAFMPNRLSMTCSRRNCSYWRRCEREWGGEVPET